MSDTGDDEQGDTVNEAFICDAVRTPIGRYGGALSMVRTDDLGAVPIRALIERNPGVDWGAVDDVVYGCANQAGEDNRNVGRMALLLAGLVGAAQDHVVEFGPVDARVALDQRPDRDCREVVGADAAERAGVAADWCPDIVADVGFGHSFSSSSRGAERRGDPVTGLLRSARNDRK